MNKTEIRAVQKALRDVFLEDLSLYKTRFHMFSQIIAALSRVCREGTNLQHKDFREWILFGDSIVREREEDCK